MLFPKGFRDGPSFQGIRRHIGKLTRVLPLPLLRTVLPGRVFILCYHTVSSRGLPHVRNLYDFKSPHEFEQDLLFFKENCYVASHEEVVAHQDGRGRLPAGSVCITFDEGFSECHDVVRPLLLRHGMPCTFFVCTSSIDNRAMLYRNIISLCIDTVRAMTCEEFGAVTARLGDRYGVRLHNPEQLRKWMLRLTYLERDTVHAICGLLGLDIDGAVEVAGVGLVDERQRAVGLVTADQLGLVLDDGAVPLLAPTERLLGLAALGDVAGVEHDPLD